ncbi:MAG: cupredoxin domain-containing protein, partial [Actinomycetota bacterium]
MPEDEARRGTQRQQPPGRWLYGCLMSGLTVMALLGAASMYPLSASTRSATQPTARLDRLGPYSDAGSIAARTGTEHTTAVPSAAGVGSPRFAAPAQSGECSRSLVVEILEPLSKHIKVAHLERSPEGQTQDLMNTDQYVQLHTVLVENMADPAVEGVYVISDGTPPPLTNHLRVAHLERSPEGQTQDLMDTDQYAQTHTVLVQNVAVPTITVVNGSGCAPDQQSQQPQPAHSTQPATGTGGSMNVGIKDQAYAPAALAVNAGDSVIWTNNETRESGIPHTVSSSGGGPLKSGSLQPGASYTYTFANPGTYNYVCDVHPNMKGSVTVKGASSTHSSS